jgi:hypothetical protein
MSTDFATIDVGVHDVLLEQLLREAIRATPGTEISIHARLLARLSQSIQWSNSPAEQEALARKALLLADESGDSTARCEALGALAESLHGPTRAIERLAVIQQIDEASANRTDSSDTLLQHTRKITALLEIGDIDRICSENKAYREIASRSGQPHHLWYATTTDVMRSLLSGNLVLPEALEAQFCAISQTADNPNVIQGYAVQRFFRDVESERLNEVLAPLMDMISKFPLVASWQCALTWLHWNLGNREETVRCLERFPRQRVIQISTQPGSGAGIAMLAEVSAHVGDESMRRLLFEIVEPMLERCATAGYGVLYFGGYSRYAGLLARSIGLKRKAIELLRLSVDQEASRGAELWRGYSLVDLALTLGLNGAPKPRVCSALADADRVARAIRVPRLLRRIDQARAQLNSSNRNPI